MYEEELNEYRRRYRLFFAISLSYVPGVAVIGVVVVRLWGSETPVYFVAGVSSAAVRN
jgi:hypothetical protein